jgi:hypothetical protein
MSVRISEGRRKKPWAGAGAGAGGADILVAQEAMESSGGRFREVGTKTLDDVERPRRQK